MRHIFAVFRKPTPLDVMEAELLDAQLNRLVATSKQEYYQALGRMYSERVDRLTAEIRSYHDAASGSRGNDHARIGVSPNEAEVEVTDVTRSAVHALHQTPGVRNVRF